MVEGRAAQPRLRGLMYLSMMNQISRGGNGFRQALRPQTLRQRRNHIESFCSCPGLLSVLSNSIFQSVSNRRGIGPRHLSDILLVVHLEKFKQDCSLTDPRRFIHHTST